MGMGKRYFDRRKSGKMIRINQLKVIPGTEETLVAYISDTLGIKESDIEEFYIIKKSLDARKKPELFWIYSLDVKVKPSVNIKKLMRNKNVQEAPERNKYVIPECGTEKMTCRPVVVGMGPAGLFCAYLLAQKGFCPVVLEQGNDVDTRLKDVEDFWQGKPLNPNSNVQFGEGGAGTFSDGKLNTGVKDKDGRNREVLEIFVKNGAGEQILYDGKPHIGTDVLGTVVKNMRKEIQKLGGEVFFGHRFEGFETKNDLSGMNLCGIRVRKLTDNTVYNLETNHLILAIGHSARNTYEMLYNQNVPMEPKAFAVGVRVEHSQDYINRTQYGEDYNTRYKNSLPASPYKLTARAEDGRGVYSFCMCPGGFVVNASSEEGMLAVNGMSYSKRDGAHADSAIVVAVDSADYPGNHVLSGMYFQRELEQKAYKAGNGKIPVQYYMDFKNKKVTETADDLNHSLKGEYAYADVRTIFPDEISRAIVDGMEQFERIIPGFATENPLLCGVESRTSAPVRIVRNEEYQSIIKGIYPCGEGAGYAGGITSAAMDGMKVAESIISKYCPKN